MENPITALKLRNTSNIFVISNERKNMTAPSKSNYSEPSEGGKSRVLFNRGTDFILYEFSH